MDEQAVNRAIELHADSVRRVCFLYLKSKEDTEDIFQEVFLKYLLRKDGFESQAHEKAWLIRVAINCCKDFLKSFFKKKTSTLDFDIPFSDEKDREVLDAVMQLDEHYREVIYLQYYEGYSAPEIAQMLGKNTNTVYTWIARAKKELKKSLGGELE
jgi:RNA polymerase sigma-70 factor (ECF subfamily)